MGFAGWRASDPRSHRAIEFGKAFVANFPEAGSGSGKVFASLLRRPGACRGEWGACCTGWIRCTRPENNGPVGSFTCNTHPGTNPRLVSHAPTPACIEGEPRDIEGTPTWTEGMSRCIEGAFRCTEGAPTSRYVKRTPKRIEGTFTKGASESTKGNRAHRAQSCRP